MSFEKGRLIGIGGKLQHGKDAVSDYLVENHDFDKMGMSEPLNEAMIVLNPWIRLDKTPWWLKIIGQRKFVKYFNLHMDIGYTAAKEESEVRAFLQLLGTDVGREMVGEDVWVDIAARNIQKLLDTGTDVILTGIRFPNEVSMIRRLGGSLWWVERPGFVAPTASTGAHASENSVTWRDFDVVIKNDKTLDDLFVAVEDIL